MASNKKSTKSTGIFPKMAMCAVATASFMDSFCYQIIVPNLPFAVQKWFPNINDTEVGYYYGYIVSSYSLGGIFGSIFWGWFADAFGRRTSVISCLTCQMILALLFGLAPNYYFAICVRTLWGFTNGNLGVLKTYVSEMCSEDKQSLGFSLLVTMGGIANVVGPSLGGFLGDAETYFPELVKAFPKLRDLPLFLPALVGSCLSIIVLIMVLFMFPESLPKKQREENAAERKKSHTRYLEIKATMKNNKDYVPSIDDRYIIQLNEGGYLQLIRKKDVFWSCMIYGLYACIQSGQDALYPVWLILDPSHHGFSFTSSDLGWMYTGLSPIQIFSTPFLFPLLGRLFTCKQVSYLTGIIFSILLMVAPFAGYANTTPIPVQWIVILLSYGIAQCFRFFFVTNSMVFISNSTYQDFRAKVNGLGQVSSALFRFIGPSLASNVFAWSISHDYPFPFDYSLAFYILAILMLVCTAITLILPDSINYRKTTLHEYALAEHAKLEQSSIELVEMKVMEETKEEENTQPGAGNEETPALNAERVISVVPQEKKDHTEVLVNPEDHLEKDDKKQDHTEKLVDSNDQGN